MGRLYRFEARRAHLFHSSWGRNRPAAKDNRGLPKTRIVDHMRHRNFSNQSSRRRSSHAESANPGSGSTPFRCFHPGKADVYASPADWIGRTPRADWREPTPAAFGSTAAGSLMVRPHAVKSVRCLTPIIVSPSLHARLFFRAHQLAPFPL